MVSQVGDTGAFSPGCVVITVRSTFLLPARLEPGEKLGLSPQIITRSAREMLMPWRVGRSLQQVEESVGSLSGPAEARRSGSEGHAMPPK